MNLSDLPTHVSRFMTCPALASIIGLIFFGANARSYEYVKHSASRVIPENRWNAKTFTHNIILICVSRYDSQSRNFSSAVRRVFGSQSYLQVNINRLTLITKDYYRLIGFSHLYHSRPHHIKCREWGWSSLVHRSIIIFLFSLVMDRDKTYRQLLTYSRIVKYLCREYALKKEAVWSNPNEGIFLDRSIFNQYIVFLAVQELFWIIKDYCREVDFQWFICANPTENYLLAHNHCKGAQLL